jgi:protein-S-isoprenylcysteine O-methyltransferase Ste14
MARWTAPGLFATLAIPATAHAVDALGQAVAHPIARAWLIALYYLLRDAVAIAFAAFTLRRAVPHRHARDPFALAVCAAAMLLVLPFGGPGTHTSTALVLAGDVVAVVGCAWVMVSVLALGSCFGVLPEARGLVIRGPYRFVRHPVYLGEIATLVGLTLCSSATWSVAVLVLFVGAQSVRMRLEERALTAAFPEYRSYAAQTGRLLPRLRGHKQVAGVAAKTRPSGPIRARSVGWETLR